MRLPTAAGLLESQRRSVRKGKGEKMTAGEGRANLVCHLESTETALGTPGRVYLLSDYLKQEDPL